MKNLRIERYNNTHKLAWDTFVNRLDTHSILFYRDFINYHQDRYDDFSLLIFKDNKLLSILPANIDANNMMHSHQGLSYGGLLFSTNTSFSFRVEQFSVLLHFLYKKNIQKLFIKGMPHCYANDSSDKLIFHWLEAKTYRTDIYSYLPKGAYEKPNRNRLRHLENAKKQDIEIRRGKQFGEFWEKVLSPNLKDRFAVTPVHTLTEIEHLSEKFINEIILFGAYQNDVLRAGAVVFIHRDVVHVQYSAGDKNRADGSLDLLIDHIIKKYNTDKVFSFGTSSENQGKQLNGGLLYWKESFKACNDVQPFYVIETENHTLLENRFR